MPRTKTQQNQPTAEQLEAVRAFAARHGSDWREALAQAWWTGRDASQPGGHLLRQVRNTCGPSWLATAKI